MSSVPAWARAAMSELWRRVQRLEEEMKKEKEAREVKERVVVLSLIDALGLASDQHCFRWNIDAVPFDLDLQPGPQEKPCTTPAPQEEQEGSGSHPEPLEEPGTSPAPQEEQEELSSPPEPLEQPSSTLERPEEQEEPSSQPEPQEKPSFTPAQPEELKEPSSQPEPPERPAATSDPPDQPRPTAASRDSPAATRDQPAACGMPDLRPAEPPERPAATRPVLPRPAATSCDPQPAASRDQPATSGQPAPGPAEPPERPAVPPGDSDTSGNDATIAAINKVFGSTEAMKKCAEESFADVTRPLRRAEPPERPAEPPSVGGGRMSGQRLEDVTSGPQELMEIFEERVSLLVKALEMPDPPFRDVGRVLKVVRSCVDWADKHREIPPDRKTLTDRLKVLDQLAFALTDYSMCKP